MATEIDLERVKRLSELTVPVDIALAAIQITGEELLNLEEGSVHEFALRGDFEVELKVGGEVVAMGKLLTDGEIVCVEVTKIIYPGQTSN
jgi:flagellar motor switch/type III secretory pathway protein FliN